MTPTGRRYIATERWDLARELRRRQLRAAVLRWGIGLLVLGIVVALAVTR